MQDYFIQILVLICVGAFLIYAGAPLEAIVPIISFGIVGYAIFGLMSKD